MTKAIKPRLRDEAYYVRYANDFLILFQYENEAQEGMDVLKKVKVGEGESFERET